MAEVVEMIPAGQIVPDPKVNRELKEAWVARIASNFSEDLLGVLMVWERTAGEVYTPIMGQHRAAAALRAKGSDYELKCQVLRGLDEKTACDLFLRSSHVLGIPAVEKFLKGVTAGWQEEVDINRAVQGAGCRVGKDKRPRTVRGIVPLRQGYRAGGIPLVARMLKVTREAFGDEVEALSALTLSGVGRVLAEYGDDIEDTEIIERLQTIIGGPAGMHAQARLLQQVQAGGMARSVGNVIVSHLNKGRRGKKRLEQLAG